MIVDSSMPGDFESQFQKKHVRKVGIFDKNFCKSLFNNEVSYLRFIR